MTTSEKIKIANEILALIASDKQSDHEFEFFMAGGSVFLSWLDWRGEKHTRCWQTQRHSDSFPAFGHKLARGGTFCDMLCQLARWIQGRAVLPASAWKGWFKVGLARGVEEQVSKLLDNHWPAEVNCIRCHKLLTGWYDWYGHGAKSGPGHLDCDREVQL